jgi:hypothetical protein
MIWARRTLACGALCAVLSLILVTAAAYACPGGGSGSPGSAALIPTNKTFTTLNRPEPFKFVYVQEPTGDPGAKRIRLEIQPSTYFQITEYGTCHDRFGALVSLSPGQECDFMVQATRAGQSATLTGELSNGVLTRGALIS